MTLSLPLNSFTCHLLLRYQLPFYLDLTFEQLISFFQGAVLRTQFLLWVTRRQWDRDISEGTYLILGISASAEVRYNIYSSFSSSHSIELLLSVFANEMTFSFLA